MSEELLNNLNNEPMERWCKYGVIIRSCRNGADGIINSFIIERCGKLHHGYRSYGKLTSGE